MKTLAAAGAMLLWFAGPGVAHQLDEYLQQATILPGKDSFRVGIGLTPGVPVFPFVMAVIDTDGDGVISAKSATSFATQSPNNAAGFCPPPPR